MFSSSLFEVDINENLEGVKKVSGIKDGMR